MNTRWKTLPEIYTMNPSPPFGVELQKTRKTTPLTPKTYSEKAGEKEAQAQRLATQYFSEKELRRKYFQKTKRLKVEDDYAIWYPFF